MKKVNKFLCTLLVIVMCLTSMSGALVSNAASVVKSGNCGDNITWTLDSEGTLKLSGSGKMSNTNDNSIWAREYENLKKIIIGEGITTVGKLAFTGCFYVESVELPSTLTEIGMGAFAGCNIKEITIPSKVTKIGYGAFLDCEKLTDITIPASVETLGKGVFEECEGLKSITVEQGNKNYKSVDGVLYSADMKTLIKCPAASCGESFIIPNTVETIDECAFDYCYALKSIDIPYGVKSLEHGAFEHCTSLSSVTLPSSLESIGGIVFLHCIRLKEITVPLSAGTIEDCAMGYRWNSDESDVIKMTGFKIKGYANSAAETYANSNGIEFVSLGKHTHTWKSVKVESTCYAVGYEKDICTGCGSEQNYTQLPLASHSFGEWNVISDETTATCTRTGTEMRKCSVCGTEETRTIPKLTHIFTDWSETKEATVICGGEMTRTCTLCGKKETKATDKLPSNETKDEKTGISLVFSDDSFKNNGVEITAEEVSSGEKYNIAIEETSCSRLQLFDISLEIENEKVQPNNSVWVKVPLPKGYNESKTAVYYVGEDGKLEKMNSVVQDGYICFEATHFSPYVVVDESSNPNNCTCDCHKGGIKGFFFKILNFFQKLFGQNKVCACGVKH